VVAAHRRSRRLRRLAHGATSRPGARLDLRATVRAALRDGGEPIELVRKAPAQRARRLVLLVDVSGSMEPYARALVRFAHAALAEQMARLQRVAHRVVWVNPLKASEGYAPIAGGMAAALPYVDEFVEGHSVASLEHLAEVIGA